MGGLGVKYTQELTPNGNERVAESLQCGFGTLGLCCNHCAQGPCRINPFRHDKQMGRCGLLPDTIVLSNIARRIAVGMASLRMHAMAMTDVLSSRLLSKETAKASGIQRPTLKELNISELKTIAKSFDMPVRPAKIDELIREIIRMADADVCNMTGYWLTRNRVEKAYLKLFGQYSTLLSRASTLRRLSRVLTAKKGVFNKTLVSDAVIVGMRESYATSNFIYTMLAATTPPETPDADKLKNMLRYCVFQTFLTLLVAKDLKRILSPSEESPKKVRRRQRLPANVPTGEELAELLRSDHAKGIVLFLGWPHADTPRSAEYLQMTEQFAKKNVRVFVSDLASPAGITIEKGKNSLCVLPPLPEGATELIDSLYETSVLLDIEPQKLPFFISVPVRMNEILEAMAFCFSSMGLSVHLGESYPIGGSKAAMDFLCLQSPGRRKGYYLESDIARATEMILLELENSRTEKR